MFEAYLKIIKNVKQKVAITKMRISSHSLPIETGRYRKIPRDERICPFCESCNGDEFHYLIKCNHSSFSHFRAVLLERLFT